MRKPTAGPDGLSELERMLHETATRHANATHALAVAQQDRDEAIRLAVEAGRSRRYVALRALVSHQRVDQIMQAPPPRPWERIERMPGDAPGPQRQPRPARHSGQSGARLGATG
jgi:hypothetical protein